MSSKKNCLQIYFENSKTCLYYITKEQVMKKKNELGYNNCNDVSTLDCSDLQSGIYEGKLKNNN